MNEDFKKLKEKYGCQKIEFEKIIKICYKRGWSALTTEKFIRQCRSPIRLSQDEFSDLIEETNGKSPLLKILVGFEIYYIEYKFDVSQLRTVFTFENDGAKFSSFSLTEVLRHIYRNAYQIDYDKQFID